MNSSVYVSPQVSNKTSNNRLVYVWTPRTKNIAQIKQSKGIDIPRIMVNVCCKITTQATACRNNNTYRNNTKRFIYETQRQ